MQKVYGQVITTPEIAAEYGEPLPVWVEIATVKDKHKQQLLEMQIDKGESSAIALALDTPNSTLILDDQKTRKIAEKTGFGLYRNNRVIIKAKRKGIISSIKPFLAKIKQTDFCLSPEMELKALKEAKE